VGDGRVHRHRAGQLGRHLVGYQFDQKLPAADRQAQGAGVHARVNVNV
jgi:hypothetical protein